MARHFGYDYEEENLKKEVSKEIENIKKLLANNEYIDVEIYKEWKINNIYLYEITKLKGIISDIYKEFNKLYEDGEYTVNSHNKKIISVLYSKFIDRINIDTGYFSKSQYKDWKERSKYCIDSWKNNIDKIKNTKYIEEVNKLENLLACSENKRKEYNTQYIKFIEATIEAVYNIKSNEYINKKIYRAWKAKYKNIYLRLKDVDEVFTTNEDFENIMKFVDIYSSYDEIEYHNEPYINQEKQRYNKLFNNVTGISLDENQRETIIKDEINHLVVAGAGCGKTTLICGKVMYLVKKHNISPKDILLISYSKKAALEMKERLGNYKELQSIEVSTMHKLGKNIISQVENEDPRVIDEEKMYNMIKVYFEYYLKNDDKFKSKVVEFYLNYYYSVDNREFDSEEEFLKYLKDTNKLRTIRGEIVRSFEELDIANFLYANGIDYKYEARYKYDKKYAPDFYLPKYDVYIEHFGVDKNKKAAHWFTDPKMYEDMMKHKIERHIFFGTKLIETYSSMKKEGILLECLEKGLKLYDVKLKKLSNQQILNTISNTLKYENLIELIGTVISHVKSDSNNYNKLTKEYVENKKLNTYSNNRENTFIEIFNYIYQTYQNELNKYSEIDFGDMINLATKYVKENKYQNMYKYIIIDEIQDISNGTYNFINSLVENNKNCRLFCVGDDWQSIYRFAGSNIELFYNFDKLFSDTYKSYITNTYRFDSSLVDISNKFIQLDKSHIDKSVVSNKQCNGLEQCKFATNIIHILDEISKNENFKRTSVYILGRYDEDKNKLRLYYKYLKVDGGNNVSYIRQQNLDIKFLTVHKSKGLEADYVIILNCETSNIENKMKGFPTNIQDDPILDIVLPKNNIGENHINQNSEERRLFYVAMTRAKKQVFLYIPSKEENRSIYVNEIKEIKDKRK